MIRAKVKVRISEILSASRLGDCHFQLNCATVDEIGEVFHIKFLLDPKYIFTVSRKTMTPPEEYEARVVPAEVLCTPLTKNGLDFETCFQLIGQWVKDIEEEFYEAEEYKQSTMFRDEFVKFFRSKYGDSDERFDLSEIAALEAKLRQFEKDVEPLFKKEVKPEPGTRTLNEIITDVIVDANVYTKDKWVKVAGAKLYYLAKMIYKNITTSLTDMEGAKTLLAPLIS